MSSFRSKGRRHLSGASPSLFPFFTYLLLSLLFFFFISSFDGPLSLFLPIFANGRDGKFYLAQRLARLGIVGIVVIRVKPKGRDKRHSDKRHTTHNTQRTTYNTQHTTHNVQHTTYNTQHTTRKSCKKLKKLKLYLFCMVSSKDGIHRNFHELLKRVCAYCA